MRKNKFVRKSITGVYKTVVIKGLNLDRLINVLNKKGIELFSIRKMGNKTLTLRIKESDMQKFFAITNELCYNVKVKSTGGKFYIPFYLIKNFGIIIGAVIFTVCAVIFNDTLLDYSFSGTGSLYKNEVVSFLSEKGVKKYSRFSEIDLKTLGDEILSSFNGLSFASCEKRGNRLYIDLVLSEEKREVISGDVPYLISDADGVLTELKVYRGTAKLNVGDSVKKGDVIVDGYVLIRDTEVKVSVIARAVIVSEYSEEYVSEEKGQGDIALEFVKEKFGKVIESATVFERQNGDKTVYVVTLKYKNVLFAG